MSWVQESAPLDSPRLEEQPRIFPSPFMSYPYSNLYLEAYRAIQRLTQAFPNQRIGNVASAFLDGDPATIEQNPHEGPLLFNLFEKSSRARWRRSGIDRGKTTRKQAAKGAEALRDSKCS
jgi:hypothetical protein